MRDIPSSYAGPPNLSLRKFAQALAKGMNATEA